MKAHRFTIAVLVLLAGLPILADVEAEARAIEGKLMSPCCMSNTVAEHHSGTALQMRQEIRDMLRQGMTEEAILAHYVEQHGDQVLAMPTASGFNLVAWLLPLLLLVAGPVGLLLVLRGWKARRTEEPAADSSKAPAAIDPEYAKRLEERLAELD